MQKPNNMYAANGLGVVLAEKGLFDVAKDIFTQVRIICRHDQKYWASVGPGYKLNLNAHHK